MIIWWLVGICIGEIVLVGLLGGVLKKVGLGVILVVLFGVVGIVGLSKIPQVFNDISGKQIEYKSIDPSSNRYYAIGQDGTIYIIEQTTWAGLQVPVIAETK
jgi:hypothetical protein